MFLLLHNIHICAQVERMMYLIKKKYRDAPPNMKVLLASNSVSHLEFCMHTWIYYYVDVKLRLTSLIALERLFSLSCCANDSCMHVLEI